MGLETRGAPGVALAFRSAGLHLARRSADLQVSRARKFRQNADLKVGATILDAPEAPAGQKCAACPHLSFEASEGRKCDFHQFTRVAHTCGHLLSACMRPAGAHPRLGAYIATKRRRDVWPTQFSSIFADRTPKGTDKSEVCASHLARLKNCFRETKAAISMKTNDWSRKNHVAPGSVGLQVSRARDSRESADSALRSGRI